jgi:hypothetical protein
MMSLLFIITLPCLAFLCPAKSRLAKPGFTKPRPATPHRF